LLLRVPSSENLTALLRRHSVLSSRSSAIEVGA
jgi:hypothetical protein